MARYRKDIDQETFDRIERYLLGRMDSPDKTLFEEEMAADELFRNEVNLQQTLFAFVESGSFFSDKKNSELPAVAPMPKIGYRWWYAAAALIVAALAIWRFQQSSSSTPQELFASYYHADPGLPVVMSATSEYVFYDGMVSYKEGDYKKAISIWEELAKQQGYSDTLQYYTGVAYMNNHQFPQAVERLSALIKTPASSFYQKGIWHLALCYLKLEDIPTAVKWLKQLPSDEQARRLLGELESIPSK